MTSKSILGHKSINAWPLFWLTSLTMTGFMINAALGFDLNSPEGVSQMIQYSVRWAVPLIYLVVAASAMPVLFSSEASRWLLRNRKYIGLTFAVAMAWQGAFIFQMSAFHTEFYYEDIYVLRDELEGSSGYIFLIAMVITSFRFARRHLSQTQWKLIHKSGTYFLFAYPFSVYWWNLYYYADPEPIDYVFYWTGFFAFAARIAAWGKKRQQAQRVPGANNGYIGLQALGILVIAGALLAAPTGLYWQDPVSEFLTSAAWSARLELWLPFWPLQPFLPLLMGGFGTWLLTYRGQPSTTTAVPRPA